LNLDNNQEDNTAMNTITFGPDSDNDDEEERAVLPR
jgi:hypothetical protein